MITYICFVLESALPLHSPLPTCLHSPCACPQYPCNWFWEHFRRSKDIGNIPDKSSGASVICSAQAGTVCSRYAEKAGSFLSYNRNGTVLFLSAVMMITCRASQHGFCLPSSMFTPLLHEYLQRSCQPPHPTGACPGEGHVPSGRQTPSTLDLGLSGSSPREVSAQDHLSAL